MRAWYIGCDTARPVNSEVSQSVDRPHELNGASAHPPAHLNGKRVAVSERLGDLLVAEGLVSPSQVAEAVRVQATLERYAPLGQILITQRLITRDQLVSVLERHRRSSRLGAMLVKSGDISRAQLEEALARQRQGGGSLGAALLGLGHITEERFREAL
jgi:hypothetical protein